MRGVNKSTQLIKANQKKYRLSIIYCEIKKKKGPNFCFMLTMLCNNSKHPQFYLHTQQHTCKHTPAKAYLVLGKQGLALAVRSLALALGVAAPHRGAPGGGRHDRHGANLCNLVHLCGRSQAGNHCLEGSKVEPDGD